MKRLFYIVVATIMLSAFATNASAQGFSWGIKAGVNTSSINIDDDFESLESKLGYFGGVFVELGLSKTFSISADALFSAQGADDIDLSYLDVPVLLNVHLTRGLAIKAGIQPSIHIGGDDFADMEVNTFDLAMPVGISYEFGFGLILDARYQFGLTDTFKIEDTNVKSLQNVVSLSAGFRF